MEFDLNKVYYVYAWFYKTTDEIFYIGKGKNKRYCSMQHRNEYFLNILKKEKDNVGVKILQENLNEEDALSIERELINTYKLKGECKANLHEGGCGGNTGNYHSKERSEKLSNFAKTRIGEKNPMYGKTHSLEVRRKLSEINKGKILSEEHKRKLIEANTGRKKTEKELESIRQRGFFNKGKKLSKETYEKMMLHMCPYKYMVYDNDVLIFECLGHTKLHSFFKENFNCSRTIVERIIKGEWKCTFNKHKSLENISIKRIINEGVSTNPDECKDVV